MKRRNFWQPFVWALAELSPSQLLAVCPLPLDDAGPRIAQGWGLHQQQRNSYPWARVLLLQAALAAAPQLRTWKGIMGTWNKVT